MDQPDSQEIFVRDRSGRCKQIVLTKNEFCRNFKQIQRVHMKGLKSPAAKRRKLMPSDTLLSLQECCARFIAYHLDSVESFLGFPENFAKMLWNQRLSLRNDLTCEDEILIENLCKAYSDTFVTQLLLKNCLLLDRHELELKPMFKVVAKLELNGCDLSGNEEILSGFHRMTNLRCLILINNHLTACAIKKMCLPLMMNDGFLQLRKLCFVQPHLFRNKQDLIYLGSSLRKIKSLSIFAIGDGSRSEPKQIEELLRKQLSEGFQWKSTEKFQDYFESVSFCRGWVKPLIDRWEVNLIREMRARAQQKRKEQESFYGNKCAISSKATKTCQKEVTLSNILIYQILRKHFVQSKPSVNQVIQDSATNVVQNLHDVDDDDEILSIYKKK
jgi:hypothetical protein